MPCIGEQRSACFSVADLDRNLWISPWFRLGIMYFHGFLYSHRGNAAEQWEETACNIGCPDEDSVSALVPVDADRVCVL